MNRKRFLAGLFGLVAQEHGLTMKDFKRKAKKVLDRALWVTMEAEELVYRTRQAEARAEELEARAHLAEQCSREAISVLAAEVREATEGRPVSALVFDEFLRQASSGAMRERRPATGPRSAAQSIGVSLPGARA